MKPRAKKRVRSRTRKTASMDLQLASSTRSVPFAGTDPTTSSSHVSTSPRADLYCRFSDMQRRMLHQTEQTDMRPTTLLRVPRPGLPAGKGRRTAKSSFQPQARIRMRLLAQKSHMISGATFPKNMTKPNSMIRSMPSSTLSLRLKSGMLAWTSKQLCWTLSPTKLYPDCLIFALDSLAKWLTRNQVYENAARPTDLAMLVPKSIRSCLASSE
mmetsp:Transcript_107616/g.347301  ORF Transcript_107616/g.347301 Transcript_107616/m.347301 type:complete len:213 (+) Transcript_107616:403-1041(+)